VCLIIFRDKEDEIKWVNFGNRSLVFLTVKLKLQLLLYVY
jgi:hypothetical protein